MYRTNLIIGIDKEDELNSVSSKDIGINQMETLPERYFLRHGLKLATTIAIISIVNTTSAEDSFAKVLGTSSITVEKRIKMLPYQFNVPQIAGKDRMSDSEFDQAMAALEEIWESCPEDAPKDLSERHDSYLYGR